MSDRAPRALAEWLRDAWADPAAGCPPPEAWLAEEQAALAGDERERLRAHLASCPACQAESELAAAFDAGETGADAGDVERVVARLRGAEVDPPGAASSEGNRRQAPVVTLGERRRSRALGWTRLAAAAALALGLGLAYQTLRAPSPPGLPESGVVRGGSLAAVAPVGELDEVPRELRWEGEGAASAYRVRLETAAGDLLWEQEIAPAPADMTTSIELPPEMRAQLHRAVTYRWTVQAIDAAGRTVASSEPVAFRAAPAPEPPPATTPNGDLRP